MENEVSCLAGTNLNVGDFVWAEHERPSIVSAENEEHGRAGGGGNTHRQTEALPEVDLSLSDEELLPILQSAAASWGFFRVFNHGIPQALINSISAHALQFFHLPLVEKLAIACEPPISPIGYTGIAHSAGIKAWSEGLQVIPAEDWICGLLNRVPSLSDRTSFCTELIEYFNLVGTLAMRIIHLLLHGLDRDEAEVKAVFDNIDSSRVRINYYPPCPVADSTYGLPAHKDYGGLAILHQDDVGGLEVLKDGHWVGVKPEKGYLVVNVGDLIQILTNGKYRSVLHRSLVHRLRPRLSVVFFYFPPDDTKIAPMSKFVTKDSPAKYRSFYMTEYRSMFGKAVMANQSPSQFFEEIV